MSHIVTASYLLSAYYYLLRTRSQHVQIRVSIRCATQLVVAPGCHPFLVIALRNGAVNREEDQLEEIFHESPINRRTDRNTRKVTFGIGKRTTYAIALCLSLLLKL